MGVTESLRSEEAAGMEHPNPTQPNPTTTRIRSPAQQQTLREEAGDDPNAPALGLPPL